MILMKIYYNLNLECTKQKVWYFFDIYKMNLGDKVESWKPSHVYSHFKYIKSGSIARLRNPSIWKKFVPQDCVQKKM